MKKKTQEHLLILFLFADCSLVTRLISLPVLLCWLLCLIGAAASSSAAWVIWLGGHSPTNDQLLKIIPVARAFGLSTASFWLQLADLDPEREESHLRAALQSNPRELRALLRLSLLVEFSGRHTEARRLLDQATAYHRSYKSYMAALAQSARWQDTARTQRFARLALQYCPKDADGIFAQLGHSGLADQVLAGSPEKWKIDYLRFLIGQKRLTEALTHQAKLTASPLVNRYRLELCDQLFWIGYKKEAAEIFAALYPEFAAEGVFNTQLRWRPTSLGFDWRLTGHGKAKLSWRPGELEIKVAGHQEPLELVSILIEARNRSMERVIPSWDGETEGLYWQVAEAGQHWKRVALIAPPGQRERQFHLTEVRFR